MKKLHDEYIGSILNNSLKERPKKFWSYISSMKKDTNGIPTLKTDKGPAINSKMKAEALNVQYQSVFTQEDTTNIPDKACPSMPDITFTKDGIEKLLLNLNAGKASGPDNIPVRILKEAAQQIAPVLQVIFTQSYQTGELPHDWVSANIVAIFKKGNKSTPANYRPVSLTCVSTKLMEHIIFHSIMDHIDSNKLLKDYQHGFRQKHSTESQLIITMEEIARALDDRNQIDMLILAFSKAFDTVPHQRLLNKIDHYGIRNKTKGWIQTWLTTTSQRVVVDGEASETVHVDSGVPQGTVLGQLMFLLYINDFGDNITSSIKLFADDCLLFRNIKSIDDTKILQDDLSRLSMWTSKWQMLFNAKKCYTMRLHRKKQPIIQSYTMADEVLSTVSSQAYLGVEIHEKLSWKPHIKNMTSKANKTLGFIRRNLSHCSPSVKQQAYTSLVRSQLEHGATIWDPYRQNQIDSIEKIQRRAVRFICGNYNREDSVTNMRQNIGLPSLAERRQQSRLTMMYKVVNHHIAIPLPDYIRPRAGPRFRRESANQFAP